ncbi:putative proteasome subunit alpha type-7 [Malassezia pachydermatis]
MKAVENAGTAIAVRTKEGVVFGVENLIQSKLMVPGSNKRIFGVDRHIGLTSAGLTADGKHLAGRARDEANNFFDTYKQKTPVKTLAERVALYVQAFTLYSSVRPFGVAAILGGVDEERGPQLFVVEPSGMFLGYHGCAIGKGKQFAKTEIEKLNLDEMSMEQAVEEHLQGS